MIKKSFCSFLVLFVPVLFNLAFAQSPVLATIGAKKLTVEEFEKRLDKIRKETINPPSPATFMEDVTRFEIGVQEAEKQKLQNDPVVQDRLRQEMYKALVEKAIGKVVDKISVNEAEMQNYYKANPEVRTSHILIEFRPGSNEAEVAAARKRAEEIYAEVKKSKRPFEELVKLYSDDTISRDTGGDIGFQSRVTLVPTYYDEAVKMKVNEVRGLIRTRYGFHILKLTGRRSYADANKRHIRTAVFEQKRARVFDQYFEKLKSGYKVNVDKSALSKIQ